MGKALSLLVAVMMLCGMQSGAQETGPDLNRYLSMIETNQADQVRSELPSLMARYPNNPGVFYIQGMLTRDGAEAARIYQSIVDNFPRSEWADDALYKVYQFYYAIGLYRTAEMKMAQLTKDYPNSKYVTRGADVQTKNLAEEKDQSPSTLPDSVTPGTQAYKPPMPGQLPSEGTSVPSGPGQLPKVSDTRGQFVLQVGAYSLQVNAEKQKLFFENLQFPVEVITKVKDSRSLYVVWIGSYKTYEEAKAKGSDIKKKYNIDSIVVTR